MANTILSISLGTDSIIMTIFAHINQQLILLTEEFSMNKNYEPANLKLVLERHCRIIE